MRHTKLTSIAAALAMAASSLNVMSTAAAEENDITAVSPVYTDFNSNDINGEVIIELPENVSANVRITFSSPEVKNEPYYLYLINQQGQFCFQFEGYDNSDDDYRTYEMELIFTGGEYGVTAEPYKETLTFPDPNDNPDSFVTYKYTAGVDDAVSKHDWDVTSGEKNEKKFALHLNALLMGDVDKNGSIDAADASAVLAEYAAVSTGEESTLNAKQAKAADVDKNGSINAADASAILAYYAENSTGGTASWEEIVNG